MSENNEKQWLQHDGVVKAQLFCTALCTGFIAMYRDVAITGTRVPIRLKDRESLHAMLASSY